MIIIDVDLKVQGMLNLNLGVRLRFPCGTRICKYRLDVTYVEMLFCFPRKQFGLEEVFQCIEASISKYPM